MQPDSLEVIGRLDALRIAALSPGNRPEWLLIAVALVAGFGCRALLGRSRRVPASARFPDLVQPLVSLLVLTLGWRLLFHLAQVPLLRIALPLLAALSVIRVVSHLVHTLLPAQTQAALAGDWRRNINSLVWLVFALHVLGLLDPVLDLLEELALPIGTHRVTLLQILQGVLVVGTALVGSLWLGRLLERQVMGVAGVDLSLRVIITKLLRGVLLTVALLLALPLVGIDVTFLSVIGGAVGVGLGFGLQKIASNFVSGFIILLDRSVRLDDVVTVEQRKGVVTYMAARYTVLKAADGTEAIIPNETFVTSTVINHTLSARSSTQNFTLWIDQDADVHGAIAALAGMLSARPELAGGQAPSVCVNQITDAGIELQLSWWVADLARNDTSLRPRLMLAALDCLRDRQIALARRREFTLPQA